MNGIPTIILEQRKTSDTMGYFVGFSIAIILESIAVHFLARIWLGWVYSLMITIGHFVLGVGLLYWLLVLPARLPHLLTGDTLMLKFGHLLKVRIPVENMFSVDDTRQGFDQFGLEKDDNLGIMFMLTGKTNKLLLKLKEPVKVKGLRNYGYADKFIFNLDDPDLLKDFLDRQQRPDRQWVHIQGKNAMAEKKPQFINPVQGVLPAARFQPVLSLDKVSKNFGEQIAVHDLNLHFSPGELFGLLGPNGAGKTTTLKIISGLLRPSAGKIIGCNQGKIAYMPEAMMLYERMSGREFLGFLGVLYGAEAVALSKDIDTYLVRFDLLKAADRPLGTYSQGMKRKISLIGTLLKGSPVLLLDEPTNGLDPTGIIQVKELLRELVQAGKTVIVSTHILDMAERLCDRVGIMAGGKLLFMGSLDELRVKTQMNDAPLESIFIRLISE